VHTLVAVLTLTIILGLAIFLNGKPIWFRTAGLAALCAACTLVGVMAGAAYSPHHYERFGQSVYLYDTQTGKICEPFKHGIQTDANGYPLSNQSPLYPPCGD